MHDEDEDPHGDDHQPSDTSNTTLAGSSFWTRTVTASPPSRSPFPRSYRFAAACFGLPASRVSRACVCSVTSLMARVC